VLHLVYFVFHYDSFLGVFAKLRKAIISFVMSARPSLIQRSPTECGMFDLVVCLTVTFWSWSNIVAT